MMMMMIMMVVDGSDGDGYDGSNDDDDNDDGDFFPPTSSRYISERCTLGSDGPDGPIWNGLAS